MTTRPNAKRTAKMRTLTLTDEAWAVLGRLAGKGGSKSGVVERWCVSADPVDRWDQLTAIARAGQLK